MKKLADMSVKEVSAALTDDDLTYEFVGYCGDVSTQKIAGEWGTLRDALDAADGTLLSNGWVGKEVKRYGGEGQGDEYWFVFSVADADTVRLFMMSGYYQSYDGGYYDGDLIEVKPVEKTVIEYVKV